MCRLSFVPGFVTNLRRKKKKKKRDYSMREYHFMITSAPAISVLNVICLHFVFFRGNIYWPRLAFFFIETAL